MKSTASIDYVDVSSGRDAGDDVDNVAPPTPSPLTQDDAAAPIMVSADIHAVMLAPAIGNAGPLAVGVALVIQVAGAAVSVSGACSLWRRQERGYHVYALIATLACLCAAAALLTPAGS